MEGEEVIRSPGRVLEKSGRKVYVSHCSTILQKNHGISNQEKAPGIDSSKLILDRSVGIFSHTLPGEKYPMTKLVALYRRPDDAQVFDGHYDNVHTPLVRKYPGLRKLEITRFTGAPLGESKFHLMAEMYFDSKAAMDAALASPEGKAVARDLMSFAAKDVIVFFGEVQDPGS